MGGLERWVVLCRRDGTTSEYVMLSALLVIAEEFLLTTDYLERNRFIAHALTSKYIHAAEKSAP